MRQLLTQVPATIPVAGAVLLILILAAGIVPAAGQPAVTLRSFPVPGAGSLEMVAPATWKDTTRQETEKGIALTVIAFSAGEDDRFLLQVSPIRRPPAQGPIPLEEVRATVERMIDVVRPSAVEKEIPLIEVKGPGMSGYAYSVTDRAPKKGEYKYLTQGWAAVGGLHMSFTILSNAAADQRVEQALDVLRSSRQAGGPSSLIAPPAPAASGLRKLTFPGRPWAMVLDLPGFEFQSKDARSDGKGISVFGSNRATGLIISIFLEHAAGPGDARACRDFYWSKAKRGPAPRKGVTFSERKEMALLEYLVPRAAGIDINQKHVNAYMSHDGIWIDLHLSKPEFTPADQALFDAVLGSVRFLDAAVRTEGPPAEVSPAGGLAGSPASQVFTAPGGGWSVRIDLPGYTQEGIIPDYAFPARKSATPAEQVPGVLWHGASVEKGVALIVGIRKAKREQDAAACRDSTLSDIASDRSVRGSKPRRFEAQGTPMIEYLVSMMDGRPVSAKYTDAFYFHDGSCVAVSLFKVDYRPGDDATIDAVMRTIRIEDTAVPEAPPASQPRSEPAPGQPDQP